MKPLINLALQDLKRRGMTRTEARAEIRRRAKASKKKVQEPRILQATVGSYRCVCSFKPKGPAKFCAKCGGVI
jgi:hypothetical protein